MVTTIAAPNAVLRKLADDSARLGLHFVVAGDTKSPADFALAGCDFYGVAAQEALDFAFPKLCPVRHYARKNVGYLVAIKQGAEFIIETDDDNMPSEAFYRPLPRQAEVPLLEETGWTNIYGYYSDAPIWPRGLPLDAIQKALPPLPDASRVDAPIQQGLADANPDVDAIYRLTMPLPLDFASGEQRIALGHGSWCPYNSQNTIHYRDAFPLLYLPAHCSFRMTDIWRSFVAQRIAWTCGWSILFREATVVQDRNDHDLMRDFADEVPGYLGNRRIGEALASLDLASGVAAIPDNMRQCYRRLVADGHVGEAELPLLDAWLDDLAGLP
ncbi:MAG: DUF288 domain-containing protein [Novosphingobium sp.]|nr:DUF288 domain-containing protein [Novosphingobium sp.]